MGVGEKPFWVDPVKNHPLSKSSGWTFYDPIENFTDHLKNPLFVRAMSQAPCDKAKEPILKLDPMILAEFDSDRVEIFEKADIENLDGGISSLIKLKDLYTLARSKVVLTDLSYPSFGGRPQELLYAYLMDIPIIGISPRFMNSPWMVDICELIMSPRSIDQIIRQIAAMTMFEIQWKQTTREDKDSEETAP